MIWATRRISAISPLGNRSKDRVDLETEPGLGTVGGVVEVGPVHLADHENVDVVRGRHRRRQPPSPCSFRVRRCGVGTNCDQLAL